MNAWRKLSNRQQFWAIIGFFVVVFYVIYKLPGEKHHPSTAQPKTPVVHRSVAPPNTGPTAHEVSVYKVEYGVCKGITRSEIYRDYGYTPSLTTEEMILRMENDSYAAYLAVFGFEGCMDGYNGKPMRANP
jgi:hypothetical protein